MQKFDDETLMSFADGQLDEPLFSAVAEALETDPALAERLEALVLGKDLVKAVYAPLADQAVPAHLTRAVKVAARSMDGAGKESFGNVVPFAPRSRMRQPFFGFAVAACLGVLIAGPAGYLLSQSTSAVGVTVGAPLQAELVALVGSLPSGQESRLADGSSLHPVATFEDGAGRVCREFELKGASNTVAVACRVDAQWRVAFALDMPVATEGYAPAGALESLDSYLNAIEAEAPMSLDDEAVALKQLSSQP